MLSHILAAAGHRGVNTARACEILGAPPCWEHVRRWCALPSTHGLPPPNLQLRSPRRHSRPTSSVSSGCASPVQPPGQAAILSSDARPSQQLNYKQETERAQSDLKVQDHKLKQCEAAHATLQHKLSEQGSALDQALSAAATVEAQLKAACEELIGTASREKDLRAAAEESAHKARTLKVGIEQAQQVLAASQAAADTAPYVPPPQAAHGQWSRGELATMVGVILAILMFLATEHRNARERNEDAFDKFKDDLRTLLLSHHWLNEAVSRDELLARLLDVTKVAAVKVELGRLLAVAQRQSKRVGRIRFKKSSDATRDAWMNQLNYVDILLHLATAYEFRMMKQNDAALKALQGGLKLVKGDEPHTRKLAALLVHAMGETLQHDKRPQALLCFSLAAALWPTRDPCDAGVEANPLIYSNRARVLEDIYGEGWLAVLDQQRALEVNAKAQRADNPFILSGYASALHFLANAMAHAHQESHMTSQVQPPTSWNRSQPQLIDDALQLLTRAQQQCTSRGMFHPLIPLWRTDALLERGGISAAEYAELDKELKECETRRPDHGHASYSRGYLAAQQGRFSEAAVHFRRAAALYRETPLGMATPLGIVTRSMDNAQSGVIDAAVAWCEQPRGIWARRQRFPFSAPYRLWMLDAAFRKQQLTAMGSSTPSASTIPRPSAPAAPSRALRAAQSDNATTLGPHRGFLSRSSSS